MRTPTVITNCCLSGPFHNKIPYSISVNYLAHTRSLIRVFPVSNICILSNPKSKQGSQIPMCICTQASLRQLFRMTQCNFLLDVIRIQFLLHSRQFLNHCEKSLHHAQTHK